MLRRIVHFFFPPTPEPTRLVGWTSTLQSIHDR